jgi:type IV secretory pathway TrbF-like protein
MNHDASFEDAKRLYLESCGDPMVTNTYLKIALVLLSLLAVALALVDLWTIRTFENFRPLVIRIDDLGRAEAINYHNFEYKPQDAEAKYFLSQFTNLYYRRNRTPSRTISRSRCIFSTESWPTESSTPTARTTLSADS